MPQSRRKRGADRLFARLWRDRRGSVVVWTTVAIPMFFALGGLLLDVGRIFNQHSQLQAYADHVALAAAAELDGENGAVGRAVLAALGPSFPGPLVSDTHNFGTGSGDIAVGLLEFLDSLGNDPGPASDSVVCTRPAGGALSCSGVSTAVADAQVRFVRVTVEPTPMNYVLVPILNGLGIASAATSGAISAEAVAGFTRAVCNFPPLMICNPYESPSGGGDFTPTIGQQILIKSKGGGSQWGPGDFGLLSTAETAGDGYCNGGGADRIRCVMALVEPNNACVEGTVDIQPGEAVSTNRGLNVRFDIWDSPLHNKKNNAAFAPAANVTKGKIHTSGQCASNDLQAPPASPNDTMKLPRDPCLAAATCPRFGDADTAHWQGGGLDAYWQANHGGLPPAPFPTRYAAYRYEIDNALVPDKSSGGGEDGNPTCASSSIDNPQRDRRRLIVAVINCVEQGINGAVNDVPVIAFADMFLTEPVGIDATNEDDIWAEMLGVIEPGTDDGVLHEYPQLYR